MTKSDSDLIMAQGETPGPRRQRTQTAATPQPERAGPSNVEFVQAVPDRPGQVGRVIIPAGTIREDRSTIVCIGPPPQQPPLLDETRVIDRSTANRSIQLINESLDEQDNAEASAVQGKLEELQNARREFVISVATIGGNAVNLADDSDMSILDLDDVPDAFEYMSPVPFRTPPRKITKCPDISDEMFRINYHLNHPDVEAARAFSRKTQEKWDQQAVERRMEAEFARIGGQEPEDFRLDTPFVQDFMEGDISWEEDEEGNFEPCPSRIKASMPRIPKRRGTCPPQPGISVDQLERFFDTQTYPPSPCAGPPPGKESLHPDLWHIDDPWYFESPQPDVPDLMQFD